MGVGALTPCCCGGGGRGSLLGIPFECKKNSEDEKIQKYCRSKKLRTKGPIYFETSFWVYSGVREVPGDRRTAGEQNAFENQVWSLRRRIVSTL